MPPEGQGAFAAALLSPLADVPQGVVGPDGLPDQRRFAVYRNNVTVSLTEALAATFRAVTALTGEEFFKAMAREYVRMSPPRSQLLMHYGEDFPSFIEGFPPAAGLPFLGDVARLDRAWLAAYHAADVPPLDVAALAAVPHDQLPLVRFKAQPATALVTSAYPVVNLWQAARSGDASARIDPDLSQTALVTRPDIEVKVAPLRHGEAECIASLIAGETLGQAMRAADENIVQSTLAVAIGAGAFATFEFAPMED